MALAFITVESKEIWDGEAKSLFRDKSYSEAAGKFKEVLALDYENQAALRYLERIPQRIAEEKEKQERARQRKLEAEQRENERLDRMK